MCYECQLKFSCCMAEVRIKNISVELRSAHTSSPTVLLDATIFFLFFFFLHKSKMDEL